MNLLAVIAVLLVILVVLLLIPLPQNKVVFLDVGQGDAILLQSGTQQVLIDSGQGNVVLERLTEELPWFDTTIEVLVSTHPSRDHVEGFLHVLERYKVKLVLLPYVADKSQLQESWLQALHDKKIPYRFAEAGQHLKLNQVSFNILAPLTIPEAQAAIKRDINNGSIIARVDFHDLSLLLGGDAEELAEELVVQRTPPHVLDVDVLKAGHHGSKSSTTTELLQATTPQAVAISVGAKNTYGHPHESVLQRLEPYPVFRTDYHGSIRFIHHRRQWLVSCGTPATLFAPRIPCQPA